MKKIVWLLVVIPLLYCCEEEVDVDLEEAEIRLVVNGVLRVNFTEEFVPVEIAVTETSDFFSENQVTQLDDNALITYRVPNPDAPELSESIAFSSLAELEPNSGIYEPDPTFDADQRIRTQFVTPETEFLLELRHKGRSYAAETPVSYSVPIDALEQVSPLEEDEEVEITVRFTDVPEIKNYYILDFGEGEFVAIDDEFFDGQQFEISYFIERPLESGETLEVSLLGADINFHNYIALLVEQTEDDEGVFQTPSATPRGNVFDVTGLDNDEILDNVGRPNEFALGYFAVVEEFRSFITIE